MAFRRSGVRFPSGPQVPCTTTFRSSILPSLRGKVSPDSLVLHKVRIDRSDQNFGRHPDGNVIFIVREPNLDRSFVLEESAFDHKGLHNDTIERSCVDFDPLAAQDLHIEWMRLVFVKILERDFVAFMIMA